MCIIMPTLILIGASNVFGVQMLVPLGKETIVLYSEIAGAVADIILNAIFIPRFGAAGAAFGTLVAEAVVLAVQAVALKDMAWEIIRKIEIGKILTAVIVAGGVMMVVREQLNVGVFLMLVVCFGVFCGIYGGMLLLMKERILREILETIGKRIGRQENGRRL